MLGFCTDHLIYSPNSPRKDVEVVRLNYQTERAEHREAQ